MSGSGAGPSLVAALVGFGRALRAAGMAVGPGDVLTYCAAAATLDPSDLADLYWAGHTALVSRAADLPTYDEVFRRYFLAEVGADGEVVTLRAPAEAGTESVLEMPAADPGQEEPDEETVLGLMASNVETLKAKAFAECTDDERAALRRIMARLRLAPPRRRTRRTRPARGGRRPDPRRTVRRSLRSHGEPVELCWRTRRLRTRPLILLLDVSGSMADYSRALLQFAHTARRAAVGPARVEVFCFGTRLTWVTGTLRTRSPDDALARAARQVVDWEGGTRIGDAVDAFVRHWGRRGMARGGIVVICSDGLDRGDPDVLDTAMQRLARLCHRVVWLDPHAAPDRRPQTLAHTVAEPYVDRLLSGHDLASLERLAAVLPGLG